MKCVAFIPIKLNNERLPGKNLKPFDNGSPLISYILETALKVERINEIYVYCSSEQVQNVLPAGVEFLQRPKTLDSSSTSITEVIFSFTQAIFADIYILLHATAPFILADSIKRGINVIENEGYDSALTVKKHREFVWRDGKPENYDILNIPRTQDLEPFYTETTGFYCFTRQLAKQKRRIGKKPFLIEVSDIEAIDINEPLDYEIANAVYNQIISRK